MIGYALAQPIAATFMVLFGLCALVGIVDRVTEPYRLRARARADWARAEMLRATREATPSKIAPFADHLARNGAAQQRRASRWGKGT